jgi:hypothetical protein
MENSVFGLPVPPPNADFPEIMSTFFIPLILKMLAVSGGLLLVTIIFGGLIIFYIYKRYKMMSVLNATDMVKQLSVLSAANTDLSPFNLETCKSIGGVYDRNGTHMQNAYTKSDLILNNENNQKSLIACGYLKNFKPFKGILMAAFDKHKLEIYLDNDTIKGFAYSYFLDGNFIGGQKFETFFSEHINYISDNQGIILWHNRPKFVASEAKIGIVKIAAGTSYNFYKDQSNTQLIAHVNRGYGVSSWMGAASTINTDGTRIEFADPNIPLNHKALILGFLLIDKMFNV